MKIVSVLGMFITMDKTELLKGEAWFNDAIPKSRGRRERIN